MFLFRLLRKLKSRVIRNLFLFFIPLVGLFNCFKLSEHEKSNHIFQNYLRYFTENNVDFLARNRFDEHLVQVNAANFKAYLRKLDFYDAEMTLLDTTKLSPENQIDYVLLKRHLGRLRFNYATRKTWQHDPVWYAQLLGNSLYWPTVVPKLARPEAEAILISRLKQLPRFLSQAQENLVSSDIRRMTLAQKQSAALEDFLNTGIEQPIAPTPAFADSLKIYRPAALAALQNWRDFLKKRLPADAVKMSGAEFTEWLKLTLGAEANPGELRDLGERELQQLPARMQTTVIELFRKQLPRKVFQNAAARKTGFSISEALDRVRSDYLKPGAILPFIEEIAAESERFLQFKGLLKLPNRGKIIYSVLPGFLTGDPFSQIFLAEKQPWFFIQRPAADGNLPGELEFCQYFNKNRLKILTLNQLVPGQALQLLYADSLATPIQRHFGDGVIQAAWPMFAPYLMRKSGFSGYDPAFILTQQMEYFQSALGTRLCLEYFLNALDESSMRQTLATQGFLEGNILETLLDEMILHPERVIARFWGFYQLRQLYEDVRVSQPSRFSIVEFNQKILNSGFVPINSIRRCLLHPSF
jgi:hypothetical protein